MPPAISEILRGTRYDAATSHTDGALRRRSPVNPVTNVFPLVVVLTVSMVKEAAEDNKRRKKDAQARRRQRLVLTVSQSLNILALLALPP